LDEFVERLKEKYIDELEKIILFGGYARGVAGEESDIDVLVVVESLPREWERRMDDILDITTDIALTYGVKISPLLLSQDEFLDNISSEALLFIDLTRGYKMLYNRAGDELEKFKRVIERKYVYSEELEAWIES
jgi:predicted nucleotidyltransferase